MPTSLATHSAGALFCTCFSAASNSLRMRVENSICKVHKSSRRQCWRWAWRRSRCGWGWQMDGKCGSGIGACHVWDFSPRASCLLLNKSGSYYYPQLGRHMQHTHTYAQQRYQKQNQNQNRSRCRRKKPVEQSVRAAPLMLTYAVRAGQAEVTEQKGGRAKANCYKQVAQWHSINVNVNSNVT